jgi:hypothetical protein
MTHSLIIKEESFFDIYESLSMKWCDNISNSRWKKVTKSLLILLENGTKTGCLLFENGIMFKQRINKTLTDTNKISFSINE